MNKSATLPKLKITKHFGGGAPAEQTCSLEQAREYLGNFWQDEQWAGVLVAVDDRLVHSYEELKQLVMREGYKYREFIQVGIYPQAGGG